MERLTQKMHQPLAFTVPTAEKILTDAILICAILLVNRAGLGGNIAFMAIAVGYLVQARDGGFKAFVLVALAPILNEAFSVNGGSMFTAGRFLMYGLILVALYVRSEWMIRNSPYWTVIWLMVLYVIVCLLLAFVKGYFVQVSASKLITFGVGTGCGILVALRSRYMDRSTSYWVLSVFVSIALFGLIAIALGQGYNGKGDASLQRGFFNGPMYHSNTLGPMAAMIAVTLLGFSIAEGRNKLCIATIPIFIVFIWMTKSRTGLGAFLVGTIFIVAIYYFRSHRRLLSPQQVSLVRNIVITVMLGGTALFVYDSFTDGKYLNRLLTFVSKSEKADTFEKVDVRTVLSSRIDKYEEGWHNFLQNPITGIGFGTATGPSFSRNASMFSAPIEKGFIVVAVLEETGSVGAFFFLIFVGSFLMTLYNQGNIVGFVGLTVYLIINCGETMFFSYGGHGAFGWALVMCSIVIGQTSHVKLAISDQSSFTQSVRTVPIGIQYRDRSNVRRRDC